MEYFFLRLNNDGAWLLLSGLSNAHNFLFHIQHEQSHTIPLSILLGVRVQKVQTSRVKTQRFSFLYLLVEAQQPFLTTVKRLLDVATTPSVAK
jgi:hypothetical protein